MRPRTGTDFGVVVLVVASWRVPSPASSSVVAVVTTGVPLCFPLLPPGGGVVVPLLPV